MEHALPAGALHLVVGRRKLAPEQTRLDLAVVVVHEADRHVKTDGADGGDDLAGLFEGR